MRNAATMPRLVRVYEPDVERCVTALERFLAAPFPQSTARPRPPRLPSKHVSLPLAPPKAPRPPQPKPLAEQPEGREGGGR